MKNLFKTVVIIFLLVFVSCSKDDVFTETETQEIVNTKQIEQTRNNVNELLESPKDVVILSDEEFNALVSSLTGRSSVCRGSSTFVVCNPRYAGCHVTMQFAAYEDGVGGYKLTRGDGVTYSISAGAYNSFCNMQ